MQPRGRLLNVVVIVDVIFAVTEISVTTGTVTKFQFRIADIGATADGTAVGVVCGLLLGCIGSISDRAGCLPLLLDTKSAIF